MPLTCPINHWQIDWPKNWERINDDCNLSKLLREEADGENIVGDFFAKLKEQDGSRFESAFKQATKQLAERIDTCFLPDQLLDEPRLKSSYQRFDREIMPCLRGRLELKESFEIVALAIFKILRAQGAEV